MKKTGKTILLFVLTIIFAISAGNLSSTSQTVSELGEIISNVESNWENEYEDYFQKDFRNRSLTATEIAQELWQISCHLGSTTTFTTETDFDYSG
ncbi:MAG: hypothetical protein GDA44_00980 [Prochloron sp. SP5CPC1]|nr:hypothetical protein [Candidatus Paraprochloron terpiosi SP5CPC1]